MNPDMGERKYVLPNGTYEEGKTGENVLQMLLPYFSFFKKSGEVDGKLLEIGVKRQWYKYNSTSKVNKQNCTNTDSQSHCLYPLSKTGSPTRAGVSLTFTG